MRAVRRGNTQSMGAIAAAVSALAGALTLLALAVPATSSALTVSAYPSPGLNVASDRTEISFVGLKPSQLGPVRVVGSKSGRHAGKLMSHSGQKGVSFVPRRSFVANEKVTVTTRHKIRGAGKSYSFRVGNFKTQAARPPAGIPREGNIPPRATRFRSRPDLKAPQMIVETPASSKVAPGYVFLAPKLNGPMIVDNQGELVYYRPGIETADFKAQRYRGKPVLTWWQGPFNAGGYTEGIFVIADQNYKVIARVRSGNGYRGDLHEFTLTSRGTAFVPAYRAVLMDLSKIGGPKRAAVLDSVAQEIDVRTGRVVWEWHSLGRVGLKESKVPVPDSPKQAFDYFHINSIEEDRDGNIIISARNTSAIYKVSKATGKVLWRLNGTHSSFSAGSGVETAWQHDARMLPNGHLTIYDNGSAPPVHDVSRGLVVALDGKSKKARVVRSYSHPKKLLAGSQGNMQTLANGNVLIGWGSEPYFTEFAEDGTVLFDAHYAARNSSYRTYRMPWVGQPDTRPAAASAKLKKGAGARVWVSWNGDTRTRSWRLLGGGNAKSMKHLADVDRDGFETEITVDQAPALLAVVALDGKGKRIGRSLNFAPGSRVR